MLHLHFPKCEYQNKIQFPTHVDICSPQQINYKGHVETNVHVQVTSYSHGCIKCITCVLVLCHWGSPSRLSFDALVGWLYVVEVSLW
jgi:hypothetical protein